MKSYKQLFHQLFFLSVFIFIYSDFVFCQSSSVMWEDIIEQFIVDEEEERSIEVYLEELAELKDNPLNLNVITKEQLAVFPFLNDDQIESLLYYLYVYGPMKTIYELQMVKGMDWQTIQYLKHFVYVGEIKEKTKIPSIKNIIKYGKQEMITRLDIPLYKKAGYRSYPDSILLENPNKKYIGSPLYHSLRYSYRYKDQLYFGVTGEKDAGEPFFAHQNKKGYDFYSFYFLLQNIGNLRSLAIGNYRLNFGLGLIMNMDYSFGKSADIGTIGYKSTGIKKHSSTDEYNFLQGMALSYQLKRFRLTTFYSYRSVDGIVENRLITSIKKDGMHRIPRDYERKNQFDIQTFGGSFSFQRNNLKMGVNYVHNFFNKMLVLYAKPYSVFYPHGKNFYNLSFDYRYRWKNMTFFGENAVDGKGGKATLNSVRINPLTNYQIVFLHRYYSKEYHALYGQSFSENSILRNENGFYIGLEMNPVRYWKFFIYGDFFTFPWLKYGVDQPSSGFDGLIQANYTPKKNISMMGRYRYKVKDKNYREEENNEKIVVPYVQHKFRYQFNYTPTASLSFRTTLDYVCTFPERYARSEGYMLTQSVSYRMNFCPLSMDLGYGIFDTDNYDTRISIYEKSPLYSFSIPGFYGKGIRSYGMIKYDITPKWIITAKFAQTHYADRKEIGSGLEQINGNKKNDIYLQLRGKF